MSKPTSKVLFIFSYNDPALIDRILLDRIHRIKFDNLSWKDKLVIVNKFMMPELNEKMGLATTMKESNMFSQRYIYENIFGLSQDEWTAEQIQVIEDLKEQFRHEQIKGEGNDPKKTNQSFGTPHDIASMHVANKGELLPGQEQEHVAGPGRPAGPTTGASHNSPFGRDPLAIKSISKTFTTDKSPLQHKFKGGSPLSTENVELNNLIDSLKSKEKSSNIIKQTMLNEDKKDDEGTMLDESQLIEE